MKTPNDEAAKLRREIGTRQNLRSRLSPELRARCERYAASQVATGGTQKEIASALGVSAMSVQRWLRTTPSTAMVPVRIVATAPPEAPKAGRVIVSTPSGLRIEGLELDALCTLIARFG